MKRFLAGLILTLFTISAIFIPPASAATGSEDVCTQAQGSYGQTAACPAQHKILPDLLIQNPKTKQYEQNLGSGACYAPADLINTKVNIKNTDAKAAENVVLKFVYPAGFTYAGGPGSYDSAANTVTLDIPQLQAGETRTFYYSARVINPADTQNKPAVANHVFRVRVELNGKTNEDSAQYCIAYPVAGSGTKGGLSGTLNQVYPVPQAQKTPDTGPELFGLAALLPTALTGLLLRKKSAK
jgi:hypothetical protein